MAKDIIQGIYKIVNKINNKIYIGQSVDINARFSQHKYTIKKNINHPLYNAFRKYELDNFEFIIIEEIENINDLDLRELYWVNHYKSNDRNYGYNIRIDCRTNRGHKYSDESKNKISLSNKGKPAWNKGLKMSDEYCKTMSLSQKGKKRKPHTEETKRKIGLGNKNKIVSNEAREKQSKAHKGKKLSAESRLKVSLNHSKYNLGRKFSEETRKKLSESHKGKQWSKEQREKFRLVLLERSKNPEYIKKLSDITKKLWQDPIYRENHMKVRRA